MKLNSAFTILIASLVLSFTNVIAQKKATYMCTDNESEIETNQAYKIIFNFRICTYGYN